MPMTMDELKALTTSMGLNYYVHPEQPKLMMGVSGKHAKFQLTVTLEVDGRFLQCRSASLASCPADSPHLGAVLELLATINYQFRLVKWGWDRKDGEIVAYADSWLADGKPSREQYEGMLEFFMQGIDTNLPRIEKTIETGVDPEAAPRKAFDS